MLCFCSKALEYLVRCRGEPVSCVRFFFYVTVPLVERLSQKDAVIAQALTEKLQLFADLAESVVGAEDAASRSRLLLRGDASELQQGETLLKGAITEGRTMLHDT